MLFSFRKHFLLTICCFFLINRFQRLLYLLWLLYLMKLRMMILLSLILCIFVLVVVMLIDLVKVGFLSLALFLQLNLVCLRVWILLGFRLVVGAVHRNFNLV